MVNSLFIGSSKGPDINVVLVSAGERWTQLGFPAMEGDLSAVNVEGGNETSHDGGPLKLHSLVRLRFKNAITSVRITSFETEIVPGYSDITDPFTISVAVWVGADIMYCVLAACVAAACAANVGGVILDSEHKWSDTDLNTPEEFMENVKKKFKPIGNQ